MSWVAVAIGGAAVIGYAAQTSSADKAADAQTSAAESANSTNQRIFDTQRADNEPWRQAGAQALGQLQSPDFQKDFTAEDFKTDPGYDFRMAEGQKALERSAAARGGLQSGGTLKALTRYSQGVASDEYDKAYNRFNSDRDRRYNRLSSLAGIGQTANAETNQAGQNYANSASQNAMSVGNANAAASIASGNAMSGAVSNGANNWMQYQMMNRFAPAPTPTQKGGP